MIRTKKKALLDQDTFTASSIFDSVPYLCATFNLDEKKVKQIILTELEKLVTSQYLNQLEDAEIFAEFNEDLQSVNFYKIYNDDSKEEVFFLPKRRDAMLFLNKVIAKLDDLRSVKEQQAFEKYRFKIIDGIVENQESKGYIINLIHEEGFKARGFLPRNEILSENSLEKTNLEKGKSIKVYLLEIKTLNTSFNSSFRSEDCLPRIILSRTHTDFLTELLKLYVPEIEDGAVTIKKIVRHPGLRSKVAVHTVNHNINPIRACIGLHGSRINAISEILSGEKIDIIEWSDEIEIFIKRALSLDEIEKCVVYPAEYPGLYPIVTICTNSENLNKAIGRSGLNVKLAAMLCDVRIDLVDNVKNIRPNQSNIIQNYLIEMLDIDIELATQLVRIGYTSLSGILELPNYMSNIEGIDQDITDALVARAEEKHSYELENWIQIVSEDLLNIMKDHNILYAMPIFIDLGITDLDKLKTAGKYILDNNTQAKYKGISEIILFLIKRIPR